MEALRRLRGLADRLVGWTGRSVTVEIESKLSVTVQEPARNVKAKKTLIDPPDDYRRLTRIYVQGLLLRGLSRIEIEKQDFFEDINLGSVEDTLPGEDKSVMVEALSSLVFARFTSRRARDLKKFKHGLEPHGNEEVESRKKKKEANVYRSGN